MEYPFAMGAGLRVSETCNCLNFNGFDCVDAMISGRAGLARMLRGVLAWWMSICIGDTGKMPVFYFGACWEGWEAHSVREREL